MTTHAAPPTHSPGLDRLLADHRQEAERLRQAFDSSEEALGWVVRETFSQEGLAAAFRNLTEGGSVWNDDGLDER